MRLQVSRDDVQTLLVQLGLLLAMVVGLTLGRPVLGATRGVATGALSVPAPQAAASLTPATPAPPSVATTPWRQPMIPDRELLDRGPETAISAAPKPDAGQQGDEAENSGKGKAPLRYTVEAGDTAGEIAERFGIDVDTIMGANDLANPDSLQVGQELVILPVPGVLHTVTSGDSLGNLALAYGVTTEAIAEFNGISDPDALQVGDQLVVPGGKILVARANPGSRGGSRLAATAATGAFLWPTAGGISQPFGPGHRGIDISSWSGNPVYAADGGVVITALKDSHDYGWHLVIDHGNGYQSLYAHLSAFYVDYGERVSRGETIGAVGTTGLSTGPHLHFELSRNGAKVDPLQYLP